MAFDGRLYGIPNSLFSKSNVRSNHGTNAVQVIEIIKTPEIYDGKKQ